MAPEVPQDTEQRPSYPSDGLAVGEQVDKPSLDPISENEPSDQQQAEDGDPTHGTEAAPTAVDQLTDASALAATDNARDSQWNIEKAAQRAQYDSLGRRLLEKERNLGHLNMRSRQAIIHHTFTAFRIEDIEKELHALKTTVYNLKDGSGLPSRPKEKFPIHLHELRRSNMIDFRLTRQTVIMPTEQQPSLEVQVSEGFVSSSLAQNSEATAEGPGADSAPPIAKIGRVDSSLRGDGLMTPERLRIRSRSLLSHLADLTGNTNLAQIHSDTVDEGRVYSAGMILRPFKLLIQNETAIRNSVADIETLIEEEASEKPVVETSDQEQGDERKKKEEPKFDNKDLLEDLKLLVNFLDVDMRPTFDLRQRIKDGTAVDIEYADLWHLFERGDYVVTRSAQTHARMVVNLAGGRDPLVYKLDRDDHERPTSVDGFVVDCLTMGTDGSSYVPRLEKISIRKFHGRQPISSLPVYPLRFDANADTLRTEFLKGGRLFLDVTRDSFCHKMVRGKTLDEPSHDIDGQVIVDMALAMNARREWRPESTVWAEELTQRDRRETQDEPWCKHDRSSETCCGSDYTFKDLEIDDLNAEMFLRKMGRLMGSIAYDDLTENELMLMRPDVHAFVLRSRQWVTVRTSDLHEVVFENSFSDLVLPESHRITVQALVKTHENRRTPQSFSSGNSSIGAALDLVKGKGSGLVILLHGPPGVGKTSTAECVADDTRRPLYPITCGDIGETAAEVEDNLQYNFQLAHKWGCVLLLDEADIFLAKRTKTDLRHNAVTSVFLRSLEYYAGILFLTTNRVGAIDPAFKSRIQMSMFYPKLDIDVTCKLYEKFIKRAKAEQDRTNTHVFKIKEKEIMRFAKKHYRTLEKEHFDTWNGRQIRNAFQTAIALTEHENMTKKPDDPKPVLGKSQFETVASGFRKFDEYLILTLGATEGDTAKREGWRDDGFANVGAPHNMATPYALQGTMGRPLHGSYAKPTAKQAAEASESDEESESDSDSDEDEDEDESENESEKRRKSHKGKSAAATATGTQPDPGFDMEEFQQFLKWKKMRS